MPSARRRVVLLAALATASAVALPGLARAAVVVSGTVSVGSNPLGEALSPGGGTLYVANFTSNTLSVVNTATKAVTNTVTLSGNPDGVAVSPDGATIYVTNYTAATVTVISAITLTVTGTIPAGNNPTAVITNADGGTLYVTDFGAGTLSILNVATSSIAHAVTVGTAPGVVALNSAGTIAYVTNGVSNTVSVVSTASATVTATVTVGSDPTGVTLSRDGSTLYVANSSSNTLSLVNTATNTVTGTVTTGTNPAVVKASPDGTTIYIANTNDGTASVLSTATNTITSTVGIGGQPKDVAVSADGTTAYVTNFGSGTVSIITGLSAVPSAPTGLTATPTGTAATLTFSVPASDGNSPITGYQYSLDGGTSWLTLATTTSGTTVTGTLTGLAPGFYSVIVRAVNALGHSASSTAASFIDGSCACPTSVLPSTFALPGRAFLTVVSGRTSVAITFSVSTVAKGTTIKSYQVSMDGGETWKTTPTTLGPHGYRTAVVTKLKAGSTYEVAVRALTSQGVGAETTERKISLGRGWYADPVSPKARRAEVGPSSLPAAKTFTTALYRSHAGLLAPPVTTAKGHHLEVGQALTLAGDGLFDFDSATITKQGKAQLVALVSSLLGDKAIVCEGYSDYAGLEPHELALSAARAKAVCSALRADGARVTTISAGYGRARPVVVGGDVADRAANRRVVIRVTK